MPIHASPALASHLTDLEEAALVYDASSPAADWPEARRTLLEAFTLSQQAAREPAPIVYVVHGDDLLGRRGAPAAMVATGLLSAARTAALELVRAGVPVNVVAVADDSPPAVIARWITHLAGGDGPTGELVRLGPGHLGKALP